MGHHGYVEVKVVRGMSREVRPLVRRLYLWERGQVGLGYVYHEATEDEGRRGFFAPIPSEPAAFSPSPSIFPLGDGPDGKRDRPTTKDEIAPSDQ